MQVHVHATPEELGRSAAEQAADILRKRLAQQERVHLILATGASKFATLKFLAESPNIPWSRVSCFHLDEYLGLSENHPASFRKYLRERFVQQLPEPLASFEYINGEGDAQAECQRLAAAIQAVQIDLAMIGIGENGHLAFNDPPADFETEVPYLVVDLDDACRQQQLGEGWFPTFDDVPRQAISMSVQHILKSHAIICSVPDQRKAAAVQRAVEGEVTPECPASILQKHSSMDLYLDAAAASKLTLPQA
jgi:glucosamine-6-phosphate deaminase